MNLNRKYKAKMKASANCTTDEKINGQQADVEPKAPPTGTGITSEHLKLPSKLLKMLPSVVQKYMDYSSPLSDVPDEFLITPFLAAIGALIGRNRYIELGGITIYPVIWTVIFAGSSTLRKSTALNIAKKPFKKLNEKWRNDYEWELGRYEQGRQQAKDSGEQFDSPEPKKKTLFCSDGFSDLTFWEMLRDSESLISMPGEFTALWLELTRPRNSLQDLALQIFDAEDSIRRNTKAGGDIELNNPVWCLAGATTTAGFQRRLTVTERGSGLLQRILPVIIEERTKPFKAVTELPRPDAELYHDLTEDMKALELLDSKPVPLSVEAEERFTQWSHQLNQKAVKLENSIADIGGYVSRLNIYGLKFALIFQTLDDPDKPISAGNMQASICLCDWLLNHMVYMLKNNYIFNRYYADRIKILELIKKTGSMNRTDLMNLSNMDKIQLDRALENEIEAGHIVLTEVSTGGRPVREYKYVYTT